MKRLIIALALLATPACAADAPKPTAAELQTANDTLKAQVATDAKELAVYRQLLTEANERAAAAMAKQP